MNFTCIGFDVRKWPWSGEFNVDETGWEKNDEVYSNLMAEFGLKENEYQLLSIKDQALFFKVSEYVAKNEDCNLVAIKLPSDVVRLQDTRYGYNTASTELDMANLICRGFDVCDLNGLFSILHNPQLGKGGSRLISESRLIEALELMQIANVLDPGHSPFVVAKVYSLK